MESASRQVRRRERLIVDGLVALVWAFIATVLILVGLLIAALGVVAHLAIRVRPGLARNINYDPSSVALWAPAPFFVGLVLLLAFAWAARRRGRGASRERGY